MNGLRNDERISRKHKRPTPEPGEWHVWEHSRDVHEITLRLPHVGDEAWFLLASDIHWDSIVCDRDLLKAHFDEAVERNAPILINGDFFDACQGRYDPRRAEDELRPEFSGPGINYFDEVVERAAEWLAPYRDHLVLFGMGNHEELIRIHNQIHLLERLVERLRCKPKSAGKYENAHCGGYDGYVAFTIYRTGGCQQSKKLYYHHGSGGGGPVTRGVIRTARQGATVDADILWGGHVHEQWAVRTARKFLHRTMERREKSQLHICTPGYQGENAWALRKGHNPKVRGSYWLRFWRKSISEVCVDTREAT